MANKKNTVKKKKVKNRRMRRTVMGTLSVVFMLSAIIVALIPTPKSEAATGAGEDDDANRPALNDSCTVSDTGIIPEYKNAPVYFAGDKSIMVAYCNDISKLQKVGVVASANKTISTIDVPENMPAYLEYKNQMIAVNENNQPLYYIPSEYAEMVDVSTDSGKIKEVFEDFDILLCTADTYGKWQDSILYAYSGEPLEAGQIYNPVVSANSIESINASYTVSKQLQIPIRYIGSEACERKYDTSLEDEDHQLAWNEATTNYKYDSTRTVKYDNEYIDANEEKNDGHLIGVFEYEKNSSIQRVNLPDSMIAIGDNAFRRAQITSINIGPNVTYIGNYAFRGSLLSELKMKKDPNTFAVDSSLKMLGDFAFADASQLQSPDIESMSQIVLPDSISNIGNYCFDNCSNIKTIGLGKGVIPLNLGNGAFFKCSSLKEIYLPAKTTHIDKAEQLFYKCENLKTLQLPSDAGNDTQIFSHTNVKGCFNLESVIVPSNDIRIACKDDIEYIKKRFNRNPEKLATGSDQDAFSRDNLGFGKAQFDKYDVSEKFCISASEQSYAYGYAMVHSNAFHYLDEGLQDVYEKNIEGNTFGIRIVDQDGVKVGEVVYATSLTGDRKDARNVIIPDYVRDIPVRRICGDVFSDLGSRNDPNKDMVFLYIPETVTAIDTGAFSGCSGLRTVYFENDLTLESIGEDAFNIKAQTAGYPSYEEGEEYDKTKNYSAGIDDCLRFIGTISDASLAYNYAMNEGNTYNDADFEPQYITFCSDYPENLEVRLCEKKIMDEETGEQTGSVLTPMLVDFPQKEKVPVSGNSTGFVANGYAPNGYSLTSYTGDYLPEIMTNFKQNSIALSAISKTGGYSSNEQEVINALYKPVITPGISEFADYVFKEKDIEEIQLQNIKEIPDYAFDDCKKLSNVTISSAIDEIGLIPFKGCESLTNGLTIEQPAKYYVKNGIIYEYLEDGSQKIVECLESRGKSPLTGVSAIGSDEFAQVSEIAPYAFYQCDGIQVAALDSSTITTVPKSCFEDCTSLSVCYLPKTLKKVEEDAFRNTAISMLRVPVEYCDFINEPFDNVSTMTVECPPEPCQVYDYFHDRKATLEELPPDESKEYHVYFYDDNICIKEEIVKEGQDATPPDIDSEYFVGWSVPYTKVHNTVITMAQYATDRLFKIEFVDREPGTGKWGTLELPYGAVIGDAPRTPSRTGYIFIGWSPDNYATMTVKKDTTIYAEYMEDPSYVKPDPSQKFKVTFVDFDGVTELDSQIVQYGELPAKTEVIPVKEGYEFTTWSPSNYYEMPVEGDTKVVALYKKSAVDQSDLTGGNSGSNTAGSSGSSGGSASGSGSGGSSKPNNGQAQTNPSPAPSGTNNTTNKPSSTTTSKPSGGSTGSSSSSQSVSSNKTNGKETKVDVSKTGISNKNLVSAAVSGSNDNFVVKITDNDEARALVEQALLNNYGSLDNLKFFAMDISLYDSTGTTKIADTTGITVTITMPLPDVMAGYAGNNKAMAVKNGMMEKLNARLITIDNVPCISFDATHFSPYAIYVETNNLVQADVSDVTPKTGDPIHPKWFLALGLALMSVIMFLGKGSKNKIVKVIK